MSTATAVRTRKPRNTAASLIASEFTKYTTLSDGSIWDEVVLPTPVESHPTTAKSGHQPAILFFVAAILVMVLAKVLIGLILIATKITKKIAAQIAAFIAIQAGSSRHYQDYSQIFG